MISKRYHAASPTRFDVSRLALVATAPMNCSGVESRDHIDGRGKHQYAVATDSKRPPKFFPCFGKDAFDRRDDRDRHFDLVEFGWLDRRQSGVGTCSCSIAHRSGRQGSVCLNRAGRAPCLAVAAQCEYAGAASGERRRNASTVHSFDFAAKHGQVHSTKGERTQVSRVVVGQREVY